MQETTRDHDIYLTIREMTLLPSTITSGDALMDEILRGGIPSGVVTEIVGESGSGKTQFALQLALLVQLSQAKGGLRGSTCYLTTTGALPTSRLVEISQKHLLLSPDSCDLANIHTRSVASIGELQHILSRALPSLAQLLAKPPSTHPLKLLVLDSVTALFRSDRKTTSQTLFERSREITEVSWKLHQLTSSYNLATVVINEVNSTFGRVESSQPMQDDELARMLYSDQARWFSRANSLPSEQLSEASLGLAWANQVGIRIMLTRTGRRKYLSVLGNDKRRTKDTSSNEEKPVGDASNEATLIRRLSVVFSSFCPPSSIDFIISSSGVTSIDEHVKVD